MEHRTMYIKREDVMAELERERAFNHLTNNHSAQKLIDDCLSTIAAGVQKIIGVECSETTSELPESVMEDSPFPISFSDFKKILTHIEKRIEFDTALDKLCFNLNNQTRQDTNLFLPSEANDVIKLLAILTNDSSEWIEYFVYDLNCGKDYKEDMIQDENQQSVSLRTIEDLWTILVQNAKERRK